MKGLKRIFAVSALLLPLAAIAVAQPGTPDAGSSRWGAGRSHGGPGGHGRMDRGDRMERMLERLDLSDAQRKRIESLRESSAKEHGEQRKQMMRIEHDIRGEMLKDQPDRQAVVRLTRQAGELRTKMQVQRVEQRFAIREVLTPEQREKLWSSQPRGGGEWSGRKRSHRGPSQDS